jgi:hydroxymethylpyrimidine/phosphomethylpyrimidine kinase
MTLIPSSHHILPEENFGSRMPTDSATASDIHHANPAHMLVFNANDPCAAGGLAADVLAAACVGVLALPVMTGAFARDTAQIFDFYPLDDEALMEQARAVLEDIEFQAIKLGFAGTPDNLGVVAGLAADYAEIPFIAHMPDLSWWRNEAIDAYHEAFADLVLPQTTVLIGNYNTLKRWLLPNWHLGRVPGARDIAIAASELGAQYTLVTGIDLAERGLENTLATPQSVLTSVRSQRLDNTFAGAGDTLSSTFCALLANGCELTDSMTEALKYLAGSLKNGFRPGMGHTLPDRMFWAQPQQPPADAADEAPFSASCLT